MKDTFEKIFENFTVSWDPENLTKDFTVVEYSDSVLRPKNNDACWQLYDKDVLFARNFHINYKQECVEIIDKLKELQLNLLLNDSLLINEFKNHKLHYSKVNLLKTVPGKNIKLHKDITRNICINIGLKHSNKWESYISIQPNMVDVNPDNIIKYILNDGDVCLLHINNPHGAICLNKSESFARYVMTYTL